VGERGDPCEIALLLVKARGNSATTLESTHNNAYPATLESTRNNAYPATLESTSKNADPTAQSRWRYGMLTAHDNLTPISWKGWEGGNP
jgi:hypothetical protein